MRSPASTSATATVAAETPAGMRRLSPTAQAIVIATTDKVNSFLLNRNTSDINKLYFPLPQRILYGSQKHRYLSKKVKRLLLSLDLVFYRTPTLLYGSFSSL